MTKEKERKEKKRLDRELPARIEHFKRCAKHASSRLLRKHARWIKFITQNNSEDSWASMLHLYCVNTIAPEMAIAEVALKRTRGRPKQRIDDMWEIIGMQDATAARGEKANLVQAAKVVKPDKTGRTRTPHEARRKAAAIRQRQYRERVTKKR